MIPPDYNDEEGQQEITQDQMINVDRQMNLTYAEQTQAEALGLLPDDETQQTPKEKK
jgi:hypothetical protein